MRLGLARVAFALAVAATGGTVARAQSSRAPAAPPAQAAVQRCRVEGRITSGIVPLPGVSVVVHVGDVLKAVTSTEIDGTYCDLVRPERNVSPVGGFHRLCRRRTHHHARRAAL